MLKLKVNLRHAALESSELITSGSVGMKIQFEFSHEWDGLMRTAVFSNGIVSKYFVVSNDDTCTIPHECLAVPNCRLIVGIYGTNGSTTVIPTIYCSLGKIEPGASLCGEPSIPPTPDIVAQIMAIANEALDTAQSVRDDADSGKFDGEPGSKGDKGEITDVAFMSKIKDYLYEASYVGLDYSDGISHFESRETTTQDYIPVGQCSSVRNGNFYGRNLDWIYNEQAEFIVRVPALGSRYASVGIAGAIPELTNEFVESHKQSDLYKIIPFYTQDGINEYGLVANTNVVPLDRGENISIPTEDLTDTINGIMLVRFILDNFKTAFEAVDYIQKHVSVWFSKSLHNQKYEQHYMIADPDRTYSLEFVNNRAVYQEISSRAYMTNFYLYGVLFNDDGTVYTPETLQNGNPETDNLITEHGSGLERWNYIVNGYSDSATQSGMRELMNGLKYTKAYRTAPEVSDPYWYTEFVGGTRHCGSPVSEFEQAVQIASENYSNRSRETGLTWQTVHSVVYDIVNRSLSAIMQEDGEEITVSLSAIFEKVGSLDKKIKEIELEASDKTYLFQQYQASGTWRIIHNLDKYPSVSVTDSSGNMVVGDVSYISEDELVITFANPFSGHAFLN